MDWITQLGISLFAYTVIAAFLWILSAGRFFNWGGFQSEKVLSLEKRIAKQEERIETQDAQIRSLMIELLNEQRKNSALEERIAMLEKERGFRIGTKVLGIWPRRPNDQRLDLEGSRDAIHDAGFEHIPLFGDAATKSNILHYVRKGEVSIIEIGGHGTTEGVPLADGLARPNFWQGLLTGRSHIRIVLFLACFSDQAMYNAVVRAGVPHIITVNGEIEDKAAVDFAQAFYNNYANGQPVAQAVMEAKLILDYTEAAKIELSKTV